MATFTRLKSGSWRVQVRRKGRYVNETFLRRKDAADGASIERRIDARNRRDTPISRRATLRRSDRLHRQDMKEVGKAAVGPRRQLYLAERATWASSASELDRERFIKFGQSARAEGAGPVTVGIDIGIIKRF